MCCKQCESRTAKQGLGEPLNRRGQTPHIRRGFQQFSARRSIGCHAHVVVMADYSGLWGSGFGGDFVRRECLSVLVGAYLGWRARGRPAAQRERKRIEWSRGSVIYHVGVLRNHLRVDIGRAADVLSPERSQAGDLGVNLTHRLGGGAGGKGGDAK